MNKIVIFLILWLVSVVGCEETLSGEPEESTPTIQEECNSEQECDKCGNDCVSLSDAIVSDCNIPTEDFKCNCDNGKCIRVEQDIECKADDDCITGGCSGTICQSKSEEPMMSTCEYKPEYACYKQINCGCIGGKCKWDETEEFKECVGNAGSGFEIIK